MYDSYQASEVLKCSRSTICRWATKLRIGKRLAGGFVFTLSELRQIESNWKGKPGRPVR